MSDRINSSNFDDFIFSNDELDNPFAESQHKQNNQTQFNNKVAEEVIVEVIEDDLDRFLQPPDRNKPKASPTQSKAINQSKSNSQVKANNNNNNSNLNKQSQSNKNLQNEENLAIPVSIRIRNDEGLLVELVDDYISQREKEPDKLLGKVLGATKANKLEAANKLKLIVESGGSLIDMSFVDLINTQKDRLGQVYNRYKEERIRLHNRMKASRLWASNERPHWLEYSAVPVSIVESETELIDSYITRRENDPRETKSFGSQILALIFDGYTRTGKLRAARLLKKAIESGAPLGLVQEEESTALDGNSELGIIFTRYCREQDRMKKRMQSAKKSMV